MQTCCPLSVLWRLYPFDGEKILTKRLLRIKMFYSEQFNEKQFMKKQFVVKERSVSLSIYVTKKP